MKMYSSAREAHKDNLVWLNVSLNAGPKNPVSTIRIVAAVSPATAKAIEMLAFGEDVKDVIEHLKACK